MSYACRVVQCRLSTKVFKRCATICTLMETMWDDGHRVDPARSHQRHKFQSLGDVLVSPILPSIRFLDIAPPCGVAPGEV